MATSVALVGNDNFSVVEYLGVLVEEDIKLLVRLIFGSGHVILQLFEVSSHLQIIDSEAMLLSLHVSLYGPDVSASDGVTTRLTVPAIYGQFSDTFDLVDLFLALLGSVLFHHF